MAVFSHAEYDLGRMEKIVHSKVRHRPQGLPITLIDKDGPTPRRMARINIPPTVADHITSPQLNVQFSGCLEEHTWPGLSKLVRWLFAASGIRCLYTINGQQAFHMIVSRLNCALR